MRFFSRLAALSLCLSAGFAFAAPPARAQQYDSGMRLETIEMQLRQLTGQIEQLQFRNQQLEQQLKRLQEDTDYRLQELGGRGGAARGASQPQPSRPPVQPGAPGRRSDVEPAENPNIMAAQPPGAAVPAQAGRRDVYDPTVNPAAPGAPRALGALPAGQPSAPLADAQEQIGPRGGREPGAPLDISTLSAEAARDQQDAAPRRIPGVPGPYASVAPPSNTPKDQFDLGYGYIQRKDYAAAEETFRNFIGRHGGDRLTPDAQYWLGESLFQRQRYRDAAEAFLVVSTKYETSAKAPDSLLRLGQSLAALREKNAACATFSEIGRKYPRASLGVKQGVEREQKRAGC
jgi:tol-pal system protein YbgF